MSFRAVYERRFGRRAMWEVALPVASNAVGGRPRAHGIGDVELAVKYVLARRLDAPRILTAGLELALPNGSGRAGSAMARRSSSRISPPARSWRDIYVQAQAKVELPADTQKADRAFVYNLYAGRDTSTSPDTWTIGVELNGENDEVALTPQVRKGLTKTGALGARVRRARAAQRAAEQGTRFVGYLLWEYLEPVRARR